jgi:hypothetical protein
MGFLLEIVTFNLPKTGPKRKHQNGVTVQAGKFRKAGAKGVPAKARRKAESAICPCMRLQLHLQFRQELHRASPLPGSQEMRPQARTQSPPGTLRQPGLEITASTMTWINTAVTE